MTLLGSAAHAATLFAPDTFETVDPFWSGGSNPFVTTGDGYLGSSKYLNISSTVSNLATHNTDTKWTGDLSSIGVGGIQGAFRNHGPDPVSLRIVLFDLAGARWTSATPLVLPADSGWVFYTFKVTSTDLARVLGTSSFGTTMSSVTRVMFRHDTGTPSANGEPVSASLDLDNMQFVKSVSTISGHVDLNDFVGAVAGQPVICTTYDSGFNQLEQRLLSLDANGNYTTTTGVEGAAFVTFKGTHWLSQAVSATLGTNQTINASLMNGDIDGDDEVGPGDFGSLSSAYGSVDGDPNWDAMADLDGDGEVGPADFGILSSNYGQTGG